MLSNPSVLFLLFIIYSFLGWLIEVIELFIRRKRFVNRGFLIGPLCPIYGIGSLLIVLVLDRYKSDMWLVFILSILFCGILEYFTSYIMEKLFNARWWDYSDKKFNINGRVCLEILILFGLGGMLIIYVLNPFLLNFLVLVPKYLMDITALLLLVFYVVDTAISFNVILEFKKATVQLKDSTEEISKKVREVISQKSLLGKRLIKAFPDVSSLGNNIIQKINEQKDEYQNRINRVFKLSKERYRRIEKYINKENKDKDG